MPRSSLSLFACLLSSFLLPIALSRLYGQVGQECRPAANHLDAIGLSRSVGLGPCAAPVSGAGTFPIFGPVIYQGGVRTQGSAESFAVNRIASAYGLEVINLGGAEATVTLNGALVFRPQDFRGRGTVMRRPVNLLAENQLTVEIGSGPGSGFSLEVFGLDHVPPIITAAVSPKPNAAGWNNSDAIVTFTCSDSMDAVNCAAPVTVTAEGANQVISGTAVDQAGQSARASVTVNLDKTAPKILAAITPAPNPAGWNNTSATVTFTCSDQISGVAACPTPVTIVNEGTSQASGSALDKAGNSSSILMVVNVDEAPPTLRLNVTPAPNAAGWNNSPVTISYDCADSRSGIKECSPPVTVGSEGVQTILGTARDWADNSITGSTLVRVDRTAPGIAISSPSDGSTVSTGMVTISGSVIELLSGVAKVTCQGTEATMTGTAFTCAVNVAPGSNSIVVKADDLAGNSGSLTLALQGMAPALDAAPNSGRQGQPSMTVTLTGSFTHFVQGITSADFGPGVSSGALNVSSSTSATVTISIDAGAAPGARDVTLTTNSEIAVSRGGFTVQAADPAILSITPNAGQPGQQRLAVTITGQFTHFTQGVTTADFGLGAAVASLTVNSPTSITAVLNLDWAASTGSRDVTLRTGGEVVTATAGFGIHSRAFDSSSTGLSVLSFAKCDGSSDDTAGMQAAMTAAVAANSVLRVDAPAPCTARTLNVPAGLTMIGPGTIQQSAGAGVSPLLYITGDGVTISGITIDGRSAGQNGGALILVKSATMLFFENNTIVHTVSGQYGLRLILTTNARIAGNQLSSIAGPGIAVTDGCSFVMVSNNRLDHTAATSGVGGLSAYTAQTGSANGIHDVIFSGNTAIETVHFCFEAGNFFSHSTDVTEVYNILFTGNTCNISNTTGTNDCSSTNAPAACGGYSFATMSNSSITLNSYDAAGQVVSIAAIEMAGCSGCNATGNTLVGDTATVFRQGSEGITANCDRCVISNNQITNWSPTSFTAGIDIHTISDPAFQSVDDNVVTGNRIVMPSGSNWVKGIYVNCNNHGSALPSASRTVISGNTVIGAGAGNGAPMALLQNDLACTLDHSVISDNTLSGATYGIQLYGGTNYTVQNNQVSGIAIPLSLAGGAKILSTPITHAPGGGRFDSSKTVESSVGAGEFVPWIGSPATPDLQARRGFSITATAAGARCDGMTDDTSALEGAITEAIRAGEALRIDGAAPCMSGPLEVHGSLRLFGPGVLRQIRGTGGASLLAVTGDGIEISGITFDGNFTGQSGAILISVKDAARFLFENNTVMNTNAGQYGFRAISLTEGRVLRNSFQSIRGPGIAIDDGSHGVRVEGNHVDHTAATDGSLSGSAFSAEVTDLLGAAISDIRFANNMALESVHFCMESGNRRSGSSDTALVSNIIFESNSCIIAHSAGVNDCAAAAGPAACGGYSMANQQDSFMLANGYDAVGLAVAGPAAGFTACRRCVMYGNVLRGGLPAGGSSPTIGISVNCAGCLIENNSLDGLEGISQGILVHTAPGLLRGEDTIIARNSLVLSVSNSVGIDIECDDAGGSIERLVVLNNSITGANAGTAVVARRGSSGCLLDSAVLGADRIHGTTFGYIFSDSANTIYRDSRLEQVVTGFLDTGGSSYLSRHP